MTLRHLACFMIGILLWGCAKPEDSSFAAQAVKRGGDCEAIAAGTALDAYGHSVGPATDIYKIEYARCMDRRRANMAQPSKDAGN
jgi:hypothetical protein